MTGSPLGADARPSPAGGRPRRAVWPRVVAACAAAATVAAILALAADTSAPASRAPALSAEDPGPGRPLEKYIDGYGDCDLGTYIKLMPCKKGAGTAACCSALKMIFKPTCACRPIPGVVLGHGGSALAFIEDFIRCNFTDEEGTQAPVDYVADTHLCFDQRAWCADPVPGVDVRMDAYETGKLQVWDEKAGWVLAGAPAGDEAAARRLADTACRALGHASVALQSGVPQVFGNATLAAAAVELACPAAAAAAGSMGQCAARPAPEGTPALVLRCEGGASPQRCVRTTQVAAGHNHLRCSAVAPERAPGIPPPGIPVPGHTRRVGAATMVCGTAGVNETRIRWYDGWDDDFYAYAPRRSNTTRRMVGVARLPRSSGLKDLLTKPELDAKREADRLARAAGASLYLEGAKHPTLASHFQDLLGEAGYSDWRR